MMLDAEAVIEAELVAQRKLAPQLLVALVRRHAGLGPDVRKVREFHSIIPDAIGGEDTRWREGQVRHPWWPASARRHTTHYDNTFDHNIFHRCANRSGYG